MPAVTTNDLATLPAVGALPPGWISRPVLGVTTSTTGFEGNGFPVRRGFAGVSLEDLDPFVHLDQMGEVTYGPGEAKGTPWHPHRGFETVTYMIDGAMEHADSNGGGGLIADGDTQWMTAGRGIVHIETPPADVVAEGGIFHGVQLWVNLPSGKKWIEPHYQLIRSGAVTLARSEDGMALARIIAGVVGDHHGPGSTHSPIGLVHATIQPGGRLTLPWPSTFNALLYVLSGTVHVGPERAPMVTGQLARFGAGDALLIEAQLEQGNRTGLLDVLVMGGQAIGEPVAWSGPFVMNTEEEIRQAFDDYAAGVFGGPPS